MLRINSVLVLVIVLACQVLVIVLVLGRVVLVLACWVLVEFGSLLQWRMMFVDLFVMPQLADVLEASMDNLSAVPQLTSQFPLHAIGTFDACDLYLSALMYDFRFFLLFFRRHRSTSLLSDFAYCYSKLSVHLSVCRPWRRDHIGWNSSKIISHSDLLAWVVRCLRSPTSRIYCKGSTPKILTHPFFMWASQTFCGKLRPIG